MKNIFLLFTFLFAASNLFGAYQIKIAVYKDHANLMSYISKIPKESYRKNILIKEKNHLYYVTSTLYESESEVKKALGIYKKVFPDAFILEVEEKKAVPESTEVVKQKVIVLVSTEAVEQGKAVSVSAEEVEQKKALPVPAEAVEQKEVLSVTTEAVAKTPESIENEQPIALDAKMLLENKTVYLCNEDGSKKAKKEVIQMDFKKEYVVYSKLSRNVPPIQIPYAFDQDRVILPMSGIDFKYKIYQESQDFLSAQSFTNDKEGHHFRYYFDEDLAFEFARRQ